MDESVGITELLLAWNQGDERALQDLMPLVHGELHRLAHAYMRREPAGHPLQTTALVNEAYLRLVDASRVEWQNRAHFFAVSAQVMRRILVDLARAHHRDKRGGNLARVSLDEALVIAHETPGPDLIALDDALESLAVFDARKSKVVELRYFGGMNIEDTAEALDVSPATIKREWAVARAWLRRDLSAS